MNYKDWNNRIAAHFFHPGMAGKNVYLYVTQELISNLGQDKGVGFADFINAVKTGRRAKEQSEGICKDALWSMKLRIEQEYPLYISYLALFVLAAGVDGEFATHAYYPKLRELLGEPSATGTYLNFGEMGQLWQNLEHWANEEKSGELGIFTCRNVGNRRHIGLPLAQALLSEKERRSLAYIFADANLDPMVPPEKEEIRLLVIGNGRNYPLNRTLQLLKETNSNTNDVRQALLEIIIDELRDWDGYVDEDSSSETGQVYGSLSLCCRIDRVAGRTDFTLRCRTKRELPEDGLLLKLDNNQSFFCEEYVDGWSSPITAINDQRLDASSLDWVQGVQMRSPDDAKWCFRLPASPIRIFVDGSSEGLSGLVEVRQLPVQKHFYLAAHEDCLELLTEWGKSSCQGFEKLAIAQGLPHRWHFLKVDLACSDELIKHRYPVMSFPTTLRLELVGGIRINRGNRFFKFAPPKLVLQGNNDSVQILCNDIPLDCDDKGIYELPLNSLELLIKAKRGEDTVRSASIFLVEDISWQFKEINYRVDRFGDRLTNSNDTGGITGALVTDFGCLNFNFNTLLPIQGKQRVVFVGRKTGQISSTVPEDWTPVWIISKGRRSQVFFCGGNLAESEPIAETCKDRKRLKDWKKLLWGERKTVYLPTQPDLRSLWKRFEKEAERV